MALDRHPALQDLSRDHQRFLLEARGIRWTVEGDPRALPAELVRQSLTKFWEDHGLPHLEEEEQVLFTYCREHAPHLQEACDALQREHDELRRMVKDARALERDSPEIEPAMAEIADYIGRHCRHEERTLFMDVQEALSEEQLAELWELSLAFRREHRTLDVIGPKGGSDNPPE